MPANTPLRRAGLGLSTSAKAVESKRITESYFKRRDAANANLVDGIFEGGGALGSAYIGALRALQEQNFWFKRVAGASAGAITASLIAVGYTAQEIEWLCASYLSRTDAETFRPPSLDRQLYPKPINFLDFLDGPENAQFFTEEVRKNTFLWNSLKGTAIDELLQYQLKGFITSGEIMEKVAEDWPGSNTPLLDPKIVLAPFKEIALPIIKAALESIRFPETEPRLKDFVLFPSENLRSIFADNVWTMIMDNSEPLRWVTNLLYNGYIFKGDVFLSTMKHLLGAKKFPNEPTRIVKFGDLPIALTVIASDTSSKSMKIYGSGITETNNMEVAEAIRRSMSIPFVFQPREGRRFMDGGMCSNYPYWLYSAAGRDYVLRTDGDDQRIKLGFLLDEENFLNPANYGCFPAKWHKQEPPFQPYEPGIVDVLKENFGDGRGRPNAVMDAALEIELGKFKFLDVMDRQQKTMDKREWHIHDKISSTLMNGLRFHEIRIPVKGYHWLDFKVNSNEDDFTSIADRGYMSTMHTLTEKKIVTSPNPLNWQIGGPYH